MCSCGTSHLPAAALKVCVLRCSYPSAAALLSSLHGRLFFNANPSVTEKTAVVTELLRNAEAEARMREMSVKYAQDVLQHYSEHA